MQCQHQLICSSASDVDSVGARLPEAPWDLCCNLPRDDITRMVMYGNSIWKNDSVL